MNKFIKALILVSLSGLLAFCAAQQEDLAPDLKAAALKDAACTMAQSAGTSNSDSTLEALPIRSSGREVGTIVEVQGACHCQNGNCDALVYLRNGEGYRLALHEKYASL